MHFLALPIFVVAIHPHCGTALPFFRADASKLIPCPHSATLLSGHGWRKESSRECIHTSSSDAREYQRFPMRTAGTSPRVAMRLNVFGLTASNRAAAFALMSGSQLMGAPKSSLDRGAD